MGLLVNAHTLPSWSTLLIGEIKLDETSRERTLSGTVQEARDSSGEERSVVLPHTNPETVLEDMEMKVLLNGTGLVR